MPSAPISPSPRFAWRSRLEPSGGHGVVDVQGAEPVQADDRVEVVEHVRRAPRRCGRRSRRPAGGRSPGRRRALAAARGLDQRGELLERAPERAAGAGRVLQVQDRARRRTPRSASPITAPARSIAFCTEPPSLSAEPGCRTTPAAPSAAPASQRADQRGQRLVADLRVLGGAVEQVDGVDQQRVDLGARDRLVEGGDLLVGVDARPPRARALVEDLDRACSRAPRRARSRWRARRRARRGRRSASGSGRLFRGMLCPACASASLPRRPAPSTSAERGPHCTTGSWPAATAAELVLRIEDTDRERSTPENVEQIFEALRWLGLDWDGDAGLPVRARATATPRSSSSCSPAATPTAPPRAPSRSRPSRRRTATAASAAPTRARAPCGCACPTTASTVVRDVIRGETRVRERACMDDLVIARADGTPVYHLAVVVDDLDAGITHVVRGADHYSNTPKQMRILEAMGAEAPLYAHVPLLHGPDGKKLSKRHGAASVQELRDAGYLPEAVRNYLALLGWGYDEDDDVLHAPRSCSERFSLERVSKSPGGLRRAEAALDERPLPARAAGRRADRAPGGLTGRSGLRRRGRDLAGEDLDAGRVLAAGGLLLRRPGRRPGGAREGARRRRRARRCWRGPARRWRRSRSRGRSRTSRRRCAAWSSARGVKPGRSSSRCASRSRERPSRRVSSRRVARAGRDETLARIDTALDAAG